MERGKEEGKGRGRETEGSAPFRKFLDPPLFRLWITDNRHLQLKHFKRCRRPCSDTPRVMLGALYIVDDYRANIIINIISITRLKNNDG